MAKEKEAVLIQNDAKETVLACINAINSHDFDKARTYVNDNMAFMGVLGARNGAEAYFDDLERMKLHYDIKKIFADQNEVCLVYDLEISGAKIFGCGWYKLQNGKISSLRVVFDPRPVLEAVSRNSN